LRFQRRTVFKYVKIIRYFGHFSDEEIDRVGPEKCYSLACQFNVVATQRIFPYPESDKRERRDSMVIHLTPEQERRVHAVMSRGAYESVEEVVDAALAAVEQRTAPGFAGTQEELDALLAEGLASKELAEEEFWGSVNAQTNGLLAEHKTGRRS
jgi:Arc/MetJ-type ribon-helix-helix transcriptional regulator